MLEFDLNWVEGALFLRHSLSRQSYYENFRSDSLDQQFAGCHRC